MSHHLAVLTVFGLISGFPVTSGCRTRTKKTGSTSSNLHLPEAKDRRSLSSVVLEEIEKYWSSALKKVVIIIFANEKFELSDKIL